MIPYGRQDINQDDIDAVIEVLKSDWLTQGPKVQDFELKVAQHCDVEHAIACNSATSALHIACLALEIGPDDIVWTSPVSFVASSNCALYCGASIDFVDIDTQTGNMSIQALTKKLEQSKSENKLPKAIIPVHLAGQPCDMYEIAELSKKYGFKVIEDASHAIGANYKGEPVGNCKYSDICVFSFHPVKIVTSAEGGMLTTKHGQLAHRAKSFRSHGITSDPKELLQQSHGPWYYEQQSLGFNYRLTDIQAALGLSQMSRLEDFVTRRNQLAEIYSDNLPKQLCHLTRLSNRRSSYHLYIVLLPEGLDQKYVVTHLRDKGVFAHVHYIPIHLQPFYQSLGFKKGDFPNAEAYYKRAITLPLHPNLTTQDIAYISSILSELL